jgi:hypothetical protein
LRMTDQPIDYFDNNCLNRKCQHQLFAYDQSIHSHLIYIKLSRNTNFTDQSIKAKTDAANRAGI